MNASAALLLPQHRVARVEVYTVDPESAGDAFVRVLERRPEALPAGPARNVPRILGIEVGSSAPIDRCMDRIEALCGEGSADLYFLVRTRRQLRAVLRALRRRARNVSDLYGIDPDYYHCVVPLTGPGHRRVERFVLGLKKNVTKVARLKSVLKRLLVALGLSRALYDGFLVLARGPASPRDITGDLVDPSC